MLAGSTSLPPTQCSRLMSNDALVVAPAAGFVWCPNAKVGTTTWYEILRRKLMPHLSAMPRCFQAGCPDRSVYKGPYPLTVPGSMKERSELCDRGRFVSFTFVRNPWDRLASAYLSKIARPKVKDKQAREVQDRVRGVFGLKRNSKVSFGHFVRWVVQQNSSTMNAHWRLHSDRCDTLHTPYEFIGRYETIQEDILHVLGLLGWSPALIPATHWSTLSRGASTALNASSKLLKLYDSPQLVELVARKYRNDIVPFGYTFPGRPPDT